MDALMAMALPFPLSSMPCMRVCDHTLHGWRTMLDPFCWLRWEHMGDGGYLHDPNSDSDGMRGFPFLESVEYMCHLWEWKTGDLVDLVEGMGST